MCSTVEIKMQWEFVKLFDYNEITMTFFSTLLLNIYDPQGGECHPGT